MSHLVVVTGGSAGIGRAVLHAAPADAHRVDVSRRGADGPVDEHIAADLADPQGWRTVGSALRRLVGSRSWERVSFVHSAGTLTPIGFTGEVDDEAYIRNVLVNSAATQVLGHLALAALADLDIPREVLMLSSGAARRSRPGWSSYGAAKAGLESWVRTVGDEQRQRGGVRVIAVAPGVVATAMQREIRDTDPASFPGVERFRRLHEAGELADVADVAARLWEVLDDRERFTGGDVLDLREVTGGRR